MLGIVYSIIAGVFICLQSIFNTRAGEKIGLWQTITIVHITGLIASLLLLAFTREGSFGSLHAVNKWYLLAGVFGVIIVSSVMKGITLLGPTLSVAILMVTQLIAALMVDTFGLFESHRVDFHFTKPLGVGIMIAGIIIFKLKG
ncbi:MAG: DMT family transporter [Bacillota bacterium]